MNWTELTAAELMRACGQVGSAEAWQEFARRFQPLMRSAAVRVSRRWGDSSAGEVDDIVQEVYLKLCAKPAQILLNCKDERAPVITGYLAVVATNIAHDFFRRRSAMKRAISTTASLDEFINSLNAPSDLERNLTLVEIERVLLDCTRGTNGNRNRAIFHLYYRQGMTADAIARLPGVRLETKGVEGVLHRLTSAIRKSLDAAQQGGIK